MNVNSRQLTASWIFSIMAHACLFLSLGLFLSEVAPVSTPAHSPMLDVRLSSATPAPATPSRLEKTSNSTVIRQRTLSDTDFEPRDADYITAWRTRIESRGTTAYRAALKQHPNLAGRLMLRVSIDAQGRLNKVMIEKSSGSATLDTLALQIVKNAAPFPPLPDEMKKDTDVLNILRTWDFSPE